MEFGIATFAAITALVYIAGMVIRATPLDNKWIPAICGGLGILLGLLGFILGVPDFPAQDWLNAAAVGGVSGLAATGLNQIGKQLSK